MCRSMYAAFPRREAKHNGKMGWKKGEVVMKADPYVHVLSNKYRQEMCSFCLRRLETKQCTSCKLYRYCGRDCQKQDWFGVHKQECGCLKRVMPNTPTDSVLLMLRLVIKHLQGESTVPMDEDRDPGVKTFHQLMSHVEEIQKDVGRCDAFSKICSTLSKLAGDTLQLPDTKTLLHIFGKMVINTFTIADEELRDIGCGIYLSPSSLDHCCTANAVVTFGGKTLYVRAVDDIPAGTLNLVSQTVFLTYIDQLAPSWERQDQLQQQYYFECQCPRCHDDSLDRLMTSGVTRKVVEQERRSSADDLDGAVKLCQTTVRKIDEIKKTTDDVDEILRLTRGCLTKVKDILSPFSVYRLRVLDLAFDAAITSALWEDALGFGLQTLEPYRRLLPQYSPQLGLQLMRMGKLQLWWDQVDDARHTLSQAEAILGVTHGTASNLYSQLVELLDQTSGCGSPSQQQPAAIEMS